MTGKSHESSTIVQCIGSDNLVPVKIQLCYVKLAVCKNDI